MLFPTDLMRLSCFFFSPQIPASGPFGLFRLSDDSDSSDEEPRPEELLATSWEDLPIMERLGLSSCDEMTEEEVESAFFQFAMAFRCDQYTLPQRLQAEEHDRAVAQENLQMELNHTKDTLQLLKARCVDSEAVEILDKMETSLDNLCRAMDDIITAAETLGAAHQEARVSHAVELMSVHVDHLKRRHTLDSAEILEARRLLQKTRGRLLSDNTDDGDVRIVRHSAQLHFARRRVSMTLIPNLAQLKDLETKFSEGLKTSEDTGSPQPEGDSREKDGQPESPESFFPPRLRRNPLLRQASTQSQDEDSESSAVPSPVPPALRLRRRSALVEQEGTESSEENEGSRETSEQSPPVSVPPTPEQHCLYSVQRSLPQWVSTSRFVIHILTLGAIFCVLFLWMLLMILIQLS
ncbi:inositol 1,4,5-triphosphate receptor associated 2 isoform X1 [Alosa sapidissima]|uniref:inositol 1,4,5-triphosphate receptor associated 2 isoform X1 n=1 Tax=Alosa sapidissima TaxID=34773 RepID=UPI001C086D9F|nr:inositol 1,4,5-triphosphate receptor associated 2 isoform X1 [Alosa sapidissima]